MIGNKKEPNPLGVGAELTLTPLYGRITITNSGLSLWRVRVSFIFSICVSGYRGGHVRYGHSTELSGLLALCGPSSSGADSYVITRARRESTLALVAGGTANCHTGT